MLMLLLLLHGPQSHNVCPTTASCRLQQLRKPVTRAFGALQRNYDLHRALAGRADSEPASAPASSPAEPMHEDHMDEDEAGPSGSATEGEQEGNTSAAGKQVTSGDAFAAQL